MAQEPRPIWQQPRGLGAPPRDQQRHAPPRRTGAARRVPVADVPAIPAAPDDVIYGSGRIDASGRVADRAITSALGYHGSLGPGLTGVSFLAHPARPVLAGIPLARYRLCLQRIRRLVLRRPDNDRTELATAFRKAMGATIVRLAGCPVSVLLVAVRGWHGEPKEPEAA